MKKQILSLLKKPSTLQEKFHFSTKNDYRKIKKILLPSKKWIDQWRKIFFKSYPRLLTIKLSHKKSLNKSQLIKAIVQRVSSRNFKKTFISLDKISQLLLYGCGLRYYKNKFDSKRYYPSAGGRYPIEIYIISLNTELKTGLYHYAVKNHSLEKLLAFKKLNLKKYFRQDFISKSSFIILMSAVFKRTFIKYQNRGYLYAIFEAGHLCQNLLLLSTDLGLRSCPIGGFDNYNLDVLLDLDGINESVIYAIAFN